ncbi:glycosyltransferase family 4 protein [Blastococcus sp. TF02A-30]|uniref:glycosyltransferase family 4 protein n=1 Tax=Blastococcus sp. TF02A-30 TaxID=2250580 RepID=UPI000E003E37|nr:glycosyltransferase family 4 protein [Blastococcus sp. TF02A-30]RBY87991.1 glycosyltransferase family 1 protein [Blastococcus sp. TF02A-30]
MQSTAIDVLFVNWRDASHPEGGGSERYVHRMAEGLAATGLRVTLFCAAHGRAPAEETVKGVRVVRRGGRLSVYPRALAFVRRHRPALVVDVQNGLPFASTLATGAPVVNLVHHVHREQWPIVFGRLGGAVGWWLESRIAPRLYRRSRYVTVSGATAAELTTLGVDAERITIVPNGIEPAPAVAVLRSATPRLVVLGRLVPHKRVEHALEVVSRLRPRWPGIRLSVVGEGWWHEELQAAAERLGVTDVVEFHGFLDEQAKHEELARAWVHLCPSVKEGWGLVVSEAGHHEVPTVGYRSAGGLRESVLDGRSGVLVEDLDQFTAAVEGLLADGDARRTMGRAAARHAASFSWPASVAALAGVLSGAAEGSAAVAVDHDVRRALAALLDDAAIRVGDGLDAHDDGGADGRPAAQGQHDGDERLHSRSRFRDGVRRSGTVDARAIMHNTAAPTRPSAQA